MVISYGSGYVKGTTWSLVDSVDKRPVKMLFFHQSQQAVEQTVQLSLICNAMMFVWRYGYVIDLIQNGNCIISFQLAQGCRGVGHSKTGQEGVRRRDEGIRLRGSGLFRWCRRHAELLDESRTTKYCSQYVAQFACNRQWPSAQGQVCWRSSHWWVKWLSQ